MSDVPDKLIPEQPARLGGPRDDATVIDGVAYGPFSGRQLDDPEECRECGTTSREMHLGFDVDTGAPRYLCVFCRLRHHSIMGGDTE